MVEVTQEARDAAVRYWGNDNPPLELVAAMQAAFNAGRASVLEELSDIMLEKSDAEHDRGYGREATTYADAAAMIGAYKEAL